MVLRDDVAPTSAESKIPADPVIAVESREPQVRGVWEVLVLAMLGGVRGEEGVAFKEALRRALARPVRLHQAWRLRISSALLALLAVLALTGAWLSVAYSPTTESAWPSVQAVDQSGAMTWFTRQVHLWSGRVALFFAALAVLRMLVSADYKYRGYLKWIAAVLLVAALAAMMASGSMLPGGAHAQGSVGALAMLVDDVPIVGGPLRAYLTAGNAQDILTRAFLTHVVFLPWVILLLVGIAHSTRTRPRPALARAPWESARAAPMWPDRILETAAFVVVVLGVVGALALGFPDDLGPQSGDAASPARPVELVFRPLAGIVALFPGGDQDLLTGPVGALSVLFALMTVFALLPVFDRGPERDPRRRLPVVIAAVAMFFVILALGVAGGGGS